MPKVVAVDAVAGVVVVESPNNGQRGGGGTTHPRCLAAGWSACRAARSMSHRAIRLICTMRSARFAAPVQCAPTNPTSTTGAPDERAAPCATRTCTVPSLPAAPNLRMNRAAPPGQKRDRVRGGTLGAGCAHGCTVHGAKRKRRVCAARLAPACARARVCVHRGFARHIDLRVPSPERPLEVPVVVARVARGGGDPHVGCEGVKPVAADGL